METQSTLFSKCYTFPLKSVTYYYYNIMNKYTEENNEHYYKFFFVTVQLIDKQRIVENVNF